MPTVTNPGALMPKSAWIHSSLELLKMQMRSPRFKPRAIRAREICAQVALCSFQETSCQWLRLVRWQGEEIPHLLQFVGDLTETRWIAMSLTARSPPAEAQRREADRASTSSGITRLMRRGYRDRPFPVGPSLHASEVPPLAAVAGGMRASAASRETSHNGADSA